jgi:hypothetical protein
MRSGTCARLDLPPHNHSLVACKDATFNFVIDLLPRQSCKLAEARNYGHDVSPLSRTIYSNLVDCNYAKRHRQRCDRGRLISDIRRTAGKEESAIAECRRPE